MLVNVAFVLCVLLGSGLGADDDGPCWDNWEHFGNTCYGFGEDAVSWADAQEMCRAIGAKLAEIETSDENEFLKLQARHRTDAHFWVGATDVFNEDTWIWISTGQEIADLYFDDWHINTPDDHAGHEDCMALQRSYDYEWNDLPCSTLSPFICERKIPVQNLCRQGWEQFEDSCYGFGETNVTWGDAGEMCRSGGGRLAEIETAEENEFLKGIARQKQGNYWVGATDVFRDGNWTWMSSAQILSFTDWADGQPDDNHDYEDCLVLSKTYDYKWNDEHCYQLTNFICETQAEETVIG